MADAKADPQSYDSLIVTDAKLLAKPLDAERYRKLPSAETIEKTRAALVEKKFSVEVVQTKEEVHYLFFFYYFFFFNFFLKTQRNRSDLVFLDFPHVEH